MGIDLKRAITFLWEDPERRRDLALGAGLGLVPVLNLVCLGYAVALFRRVVGGQDEADALPGWEGLGDHLFRGVAAFLVLVCYGSAFAILYLLVSIPVAFAIFGSNLAGHHLGGRLVLLGLVGLLVFAACEYLSLMALALYAETLEISAAFSVSELAGHLSLAGRDYLGPVGLVVAWGCLVATLAHFIPSLAVVWVLSVLLGYPWMLATFHALGQVVRLHCNPQLRDPLEFGGGGPGVPGDPSNRSGTVAPSRKASSFVDRPSETVLTWATDSDEPDAG